MHSVYHALLRFHSLSVREIKHRWHEDQVWTSGCKSSCRLFNNDNSGWHVMPTAQWLDRLPHSLVDLLGARQLKSIISSHWFTLKPLGCTGTHWIMLFSRVDVGLCILVIVAVSWKMLRNSWFDGECWHFFLLIRWPTCHVIFNVNVAVFWRKLFIIF